MKTKRRKRNRNRPLWIASGIVGALALILLVGAAVVYFTLTPYRSYHYILPNVYYAGQELSGMTREEALEAVIQVQENQEYNVTVQFPDGRQFEVKPSWSYDSGAVNAVVEAAVAYGRTADETPFRLYRAIQSARETIYDIPVSVGRSYDRSGIRAQAAEIVNDIEIPPEDCTGTGDAEARSITINPGKAERTADADAIYEAVCQALDQGSKSAVQAQYENGGINEQQLTNLVERLYNGYTSQVIESGYALNAEDHTVMVAIGTPGYSFNKDSVVSLVLQHVAEENYQPITINLEETLPQDLNLEQINAVCSSPATEVEYHDGGLTGGDTGYELDMEAAAETLKSATWGQSLTLPMTAVYPEHTLEEVQDLLFRDTLASYSTYYTNDYNRTTNLRLASAELDNTVLNAGATFSFNTFVGERTAEKGYRGAIVYVDGEEEADDGGGICQVASTIYYAALKAGLEITDRAPHHFMVTYVPAGLDATVYWGVQDFCFKNTTDYPIKLRCYLSGGAVNVTITGTNEDGHYAELSAHQVRADKDEIVYTATRYIYDRYGSLIRTDDLGESVYANH